MKASPLIFSLLLSPLATLVLADPADDARLRPLWLKLDANGDGVVALTEVHPLQARAMQAQDGDGDGNISLAEYVAYDLDPGGAGHTPIPDTVKLLENLPYAGTDDARQQLDIYLPQQPATSGPLPVIAYIHGGGWSMGSKVMARNQVLPLVASGRFAAVSIGYRLSWQAPWPAQIHDVKAAVRWIRAHADDYGFDGSRICVFGASAGGHLAAMLGTTNGVASVEGDLGEHDDQSSAVQCAVDFFGPADLTAIRPNLPPGMVSPEERLIGGPLTQNTDKAASASPQHYVDAGDVPFLIVHGTKDPLVDYSQSVAFAAALRQAGVPVVFQTVEGGGHGEFGAAAEAVNERVAAFLERMFYDPNTAVPSDTLSAERAASW